MSDKHRFPPGYVEAIERMADVLERAVRGGMRPRFADVERRFLLAMPLAAVAPRLCRNEDAGALMPVLMHAAGERGTTFMLRAAMEIAGVKAEIVSLTDLGLQVTGYSMRGGVA